MKCPVCRNNQLNSSKICSVCGFSQLQRDFVSEEDAKQWMNNVVFPCRSVWEHAQSLLEDTRTELEKYRSLYIQKLEENLELLEAHKALLELQAAYFSEEQESSEIMDDFDFLEHADDDEEELPF